MDKITKLRFALSVPPAYTAKQPNAVLLVSDRGELGVVLSSSFISHSSLCYLELDSKAIRVYISSSYSQYCGKQPYHIHFHLSELVVTLETIMISDRWPYSYEPDEYVFS